VPSLHALNGGRCNRPVVQQDNDPKHNAKCVAAMDRAPITCLFQPPQSPDLNPLENVWKIMKDHVRGPQGPGPSRICSTGPGTSGPIQKWPISVPPFLIGLSAFALSPGRAGLSLHL